MPEGKANAKLRAAIAAVAIAFPAISRAATPDWHRAVDLVWFSPTVDQRALDMSLDNLAAMGVDHVAANVWWFQDNINSTTVAP